MGHFPPVSDLSLNDTRCWHLWGGEGRGHLRWKGGKAGAHTCPWFLRLTFPSSLLAHGFVGCCGLCPGSGHLGPLSQHSPLPRQMRNVPWWPRMAGVGKLSSLPARAGKGVHRHLDPAVDSVDPSGCHSENSGLA